MSIQSLQHIHLSLRHTINLCTISEESNSKKVQKMSIQSLQHIHLSLRHTINLCIVSEEYINAHTNVETKQSNINKFICQYNLCGIDIYLCAVLSISAQSPRNQTVKKLKKCQYNLCSIYIYLCAVPSISEQSPRN